MIFFSHNYKDKPFVEHIASQIVRIYGADKVFYDSWSIQPGEGIIDKMDEGLGQAKFFFFFITENSLNSSMVTLEWQNALMRSAQGALKFIPIKCDDSIIPPLLTQTVYLDLTSSGIEEVTAQIKDIIENKSTFRPKDVEFSNLSYDVKYNSDNSLLIHISAGYYLEAISDFLICFQEKVAQEDILLDHGEPMCNMNFYQELKLTDNFGPFSTQLIGLTRGITTKMPMRLSISRKDGCQLKIAHVLHKQSHDEWKIVPLKNNTKINPPSLGNGFPTKF